MKSDFLPVSQSGPLMTSGYSKGSQKPMVILFSTALSFSLVEDYAREIGAIFDEGGEEQIVVQGFGPMEAKYTLTKFKEKYERRFTESAEGITVQVGTTGQKIRRNLTGKIGGWFKDKETDRHYLHIDVLRQDMRGGTAISHTKPHSMRIRSDKVQHLLIC